MHLPKRVALAAATMKTTEKTVGKTAMTTMIAVTGATTGGEIARHLPTDETTGTGNATGTGREIATKSGAEMTSILDPTGLSRTETLEGQSRCCELKRADCDLFCGFTMCLLFAADHRTLQRLPRVMTRLLPEMIFLPVLSRGNIGTLWITAARPKVANSRFSGRCLRWV